MTRRGRGGPGRHRWRWPHVLAVVVAVLSLATWQNVTAHRRGEAERTTGGLLGQLDLLLHEESDLQWKTLADRGAPLQVAREVGTIRKREEAILTRLHGSTARDTARLQDLVDRYHQVLDKELGLLVVSRTAEALALEHRATEPQFTALSRETTELALAAARRSRGANQLADTTLTVAMLLAAVMIGLLIRKFEHVHQAAVRTSAELLDQERRALRQAQQSQAVIEHQALHDALTGLPNRVLFTQRVEQAARQHATGGPRPAVLFIDLDDFKRVNDSLGHAAGDQLLVAVAGRLRASLRPSDTPARLGGDEFAILLGQDAGNAAEQIADRINAMLAQPFTVADTQVQVRASIGIAVAGEHAHDAAELLCNADIAMYAAKRQGKGRSAMFEPGMHALARERLELEADLRRGLDLDQFTVVYQPIVELASGRIAGAEALVRWRHPRLGLIPPAQFISIAEDTGLILPLGRTVLRRACQQARDWITHGASDRFTISVNLSAAQLRDGQLVEEVADALRDAELDGTRLVLEITEGAVLEDDGTILARLHTLRALGIRLSLDDFGTGYSSLHHLQRFPVDQVKIDRSFVTGSEGSRNGMAAAILQLSRTLQLEAVAEGIETPEQAHWLAGLHCQLGQGYHFARPLEPADFTQLLTAELEPTS
jgi:diguanylate cyclase (GGDEF)-like protein